MKPIMVRILLILLLSCGLSNAAIVTTSSTTSSGGGATAPVAVANADSPYTIASGSSTQIRTFNVTTVAGVVQINLPATPVAGEVIIIKKTNTDTSLLTVGRNSKNIDGAASNLTTNSSLLPVYYLQYDGSGWNQIAISPSGSVISKQTSTSYALAGTDSGLTVQYTGTGAGAWTIPVASSFGSTWQACVDNRESGHSANLVITATTSKFDPDNANSATLTIPYGQGACIYSDAANYSSDKYQGIASTGTGTVTATGGSLTSNAVVLGAGTTDTKVVAGITTDGTSKVTLGVAGTSVGAVALNNATSGSITLQPVTGALGSATISLPAATDTLVGKDTTDILTHKTLTDGVITGRAGASATTTAGELQRLTDVGTPTVGGLFTADGTNPKPVNGRLTLFTAAADSGNIANTDTVVCQAPVLPTGFLHQYDTIRVFVGISKSGATDSGNVNVHLGTAGTTSDTSIYSGAPLGATTLSYGGWLNFKVRSATTMRKEGFGGTGQLSETGASTAAYASDVTISNVSNALYLSVGISSSGATNTVALKSCIIEYLSAN